MAMYFSDIIVLKGVYKPDIYSVWVIVRELDRRSDRERRHQGVPNKLDSNCVSGIYLTSARHYGCFKWLTICLDYLHSSGIAYSELKYKSFGKHNWKVKSNDEEMNAMLTYLADQDAKTNDPETLEHMSYRVLRNHDLMETILPHGLRKRYHLV